MTIIYIKKWRQVLVLTATFLILSLAISSCKKKGDFLGETALNQDDLLNSASLDTFSIFTSVFTDDSVITSNPSYNVLGKYNDPKFGTFDAAFYTQFRLSGFDPVFGDVNTIVIDSFVLSMQYAGSYGTPQNLNVGVFELTESLNFDSTYYSFTQKNSNGIDLVDHSDGPIKINLTSNAIIGTDTLLPQIRVPLDTNKARQLILEASSSNGTFSSNENFLNYFKGIKVQLNDPTPSSGNGGVIYLDNLSSNSKMTVYYTQDGDNRKFEFLINGSAADFNQVTINNSGTEVQNVIDNPAMGQNQYFSQAFKSRAFIQIPGLSNFPEKAIVHTAILVLPVSIEQNSTFKLPGNIVILTKNKASDEDFVFSEVSAVYDPFRRAYVLDIRKHVQRIINGILEENVGLYIAPQFFVSSAQRIIFNGINSTNKEKPELIIKYTEF